MVLATLRGNSLKQDTLLRWHAHIKPEAVVKAQMGNDPGFQLAQLVRVLNGRREKAQAVYADLPLEEGVKQLRLEILQHLRDPRRKLVVNFHGLTLGTLTGGHFSPIAAYLPADDKVLILDTAAHKNEPFWIPLEDLYFAMMKIDAEAQRPRGWIRVESKTSTTRAQRSR